MAATGAVDRRHQKISAKDIKTTMLSQTEGLFSPGYHLPKTALSGGCMGKELKAAEGQQNILCQLEILDFKIQFELIKETKKFF